MRWSVARSRGTGRLKLLFTLRPTYATQALRSPACQMKQASPLCPAASAFRRLPTTQNHYPFLPAPHGATSARDRGAIIA